MINWDDAEYKAAGQFYALVESVSINCTDPTSEPADTTSYVYGQNASADTPSVAFSNKSTVNAARSLLSFNSELLIFTVSSTLVVSFLGALLA